MLLVPWWNVQAWNVLVTFWHPQNVYPTQRPRAHYVHCDIWSQGGRIVHPPLNFLFWTLFWGKISQVNILPTVFLASPTMWHFFPWLHFNLTYLTSISPTKLRHFIPKWLLDPLWHHILVFSMSLFQFCDILSLCHTFLQCKILSTPLLVSVRQNRNLPNHGLVCRVRQSNLTLCKVNHTQQKYINPWISVPCALT